MLGSDKSRGYCLEMICADFLAGSSTQENQLEVLVQSLERLYRTLSDEGQEKLLNRLREGPREETSSKATSRRSRARGLWPAPNPHITARRLEVPMLRVIDKLASTPSPISRPSWIGCAR
jgi:hypothetical protein